MDTSITLVLFIVALWASINLLYRAGLLRRFMLSAEVHYGLVMLIKKSKSLNPSSKNRAKLLGILGLLVYGASLLISVLTLLSTLLYRVQSGERGIIVLIPGLNITGEDLLFFLIGVFIAVGLHEYMHAKAAVKSGIPVRSWGFILAVIIPAAFVEVDEAVFRISSKLAKVAVLSAGIMANFALMLLFMFILQYVVNPYGLTVISVEPESLASRSGLKPYDVIYEINGMEASVGVLEQQLRNQEVSVIHLLIYRDNEGFKDVIVFKSKNETKLGVTLYSLAPRRSIVDLVKPRFFTHLFKALQWSFVINFSIMFINTLPLFITDGGRIVSSLLGEKTGKLVNTAVTALLVVTMLLSARF
ncbi:MAG: site-2 protease family protein [Desulfurococcaceae archaeon]